MFETVNKIDRLCPKEGTYKDGTILGTYRIWNGILPVLWENIFKEIANNNNASSYQ